MEKISGKRELNGQKDAARDPKGKRNEPEEGDNDVRSMGEINCRN